MPLEKFSKKTSGKNKCIFEKNLSKKIKFYNLFSFEKVLLVGISGKEKLSFLEWLCKSLQLNKKR
jgi:hypothetical protein